MTNEKINKLKPRTSKDNDFILPHLKLLPDVIPKGNSNLKEKEEEYCHLVVSEPHLSPLDIYRRLWPEKNNPKQSHYQFRNGKKVKARIDFLTKEYLQQNLDNILPMLTHAANSLHEQSKDAKSGKFTDYKSYDMFLRTVNMIAKIKGWYNHPKKAEIITQSCSNCGSKIDLSGKVTLDRRKKDCVI
ncbi:MAG: hypothetical protein OXE99_06750 [Cellvibrionales bacterium]|nr:hypothetical protein [Cellvibrionales bacterium]